MDRNSLASFLIACLVFAHLLIADVSARPQFGQQEPGQGPLGQGQGAPGGQQQPGGPGQILGAPGGQQQLPGQAQPSGQVPGQSGQNGQIVQDLNNPAGQQVGQQQPAAGGAAPAAAPVDQGQGQAQAPSAAEAPAVTEAAPTSTTPATSTPGTDKTTMPETNGTSLPFPGVKPPQIPWTFPQFPPVGGQNHGSGQNPNYQVNFVPLGAILFPGLFKTATGAHA